MAVVLADDDIKSLLDEVKPLPPDYERHIRPRPKRGHSEAQLGLTGKDGSSFCLIVRQSLVNALDFSVILCYCLPQTSVLLRLCRCNGRHRHSNKIEGDSFYDFHIHLATERYQDVGMDEDAYAEPTDEYADLPGALEYMLTRYGFQIPPGTQPRLL